MKEQGLLCKAFEVGVTVICSPKRNGAADAEFDVLRIDLVQCLLATKAGLNAVAHSLTFVKIGQSCRMLLNIRNCLVGLGKLYVNSSAP